MAPAPQQEDVKEGKVLGDALSTVKVQVVQMKRHLVSKQELRFVRSETDVPCRTQNNLWMLLKVRARCSLS